MTSPPSKKIIYQLSDIHIKGPVQSGDNFEDLLFAFKQVKEKLDEETVDHEDIFIVILGDIFDKGNHLLDHVGTIVATFHKIIQLLEPYRILIIPGNHDIPMNSYKYDIIEACLLNPYDHVIYTKQNGLIFEYEDLRFYAHHECLYGKEAHELKIDLDFSFINIGLFHETVKEYKGAFSTEKCNEISNYDYDMKLLGDIHEYQFIDNTTAYCGSIIQNRFGESLDKGFIRWEIENDSSDISGNSTFIDGEFCRLKLRSVFLDIPLSNSKKSLLDFISKFKKENGNSIIKSAKFSGKKKKISSNILSKFSEIVKQKLDIDIKIPKFDVEKITEVKQNVSNYEDFISETITDKELLNPVLTMFKKNYEKFKSSKKVWKILKLSWKNIGIYKGENHISFEDLKGIYRLDGKNATGKSTVFDILLYGLYGLNSFTSMKSDNIKNHEAPKKEDFFVEIELLCEGKKYKIHRGSSGHILNINNELTVSRLKEVENYLSFLPDIKEFLSRNVALQSRGFSELDRKISFHFIEDFQSMIEDTERKLRKRELKEVILDIPNVPKPDCNSTIKELEDEESKLISSLIDEEKYNEKTINKYHIEGDIPSKKDIEDLTKLLNKETSVSKVRPKGISSFDYKNISEIEVRLIKLKQESSKYIRYNSIDHKLIKEGMTEFKDSLNKKELDNIDIPVSLKLRKETILYPNYLLKYLPKDYKDKDYNVLINNFLKYSQKLKSLKIIHHMHQEIESFIKELEKIKLFIEENYSSNLNLFGKSNNFVLDITYNLNDYLVYSEGTDYSKYEKQIKEINKQLSTGCSDYERISDILCNNCKEKISYLSTSDISSLENERYKLQQTILSKKKKYENFIVSKYNNIIFNINKYKEDTYVLEKRNKYKEILEPLREFVLIHDFFHVRQRELRFIEENKKLINNRRLDSIEEEIKYLKFKHNELILNDISSMKLKRHMNKCNNICKSNISISKKLKNNRKNIESLKLWKEYEVQRDKFNKVSNERKVLETFLVVLKELIGKVLDEHLEQIELICNEILSKLFSEYKNNIKIKLNYITNTRGLRNYCLDIFENEKRMTKNAESIKFICDCLIRYSLVSLDPESASFILIDEGFGVIDQEKRPIFWNYFSEYLQTLNYSIIIDHTINTIDDIIKIDKNGNINFP